MMWWLPAASMAFAIGIIGSNGGRAQLLVARFARELGRFEGLLLSALITSCLACAIAVCSAKLLGSHLSDATMLVLAALAMIGAAIELFWPVRMEAIEEPTRSLGAISIVLLARQIFDAPRLILFAAATQLGFAPLLGLGGAIGVGLCLWIGWKYGDAIDRRGSALAARWTLALLSLVIGGLLMREALGLIS